MGQGSCLKLRSQLRSLHAQNLSSTTCGNYFPKDEDDDDEMQGDGEQAFQLHFQIA